MKPGLQPNGSRRGLAETSRGSYRVPCLGARLRAGEGAVGIRRGYGCRCNHEGCLHPCFPLQDGGRLSTSLRFLWVRAALVSVFATTRLANLHDGNYYLYPQAKQFRAQPSKGNFLTVEFQTMTKIFFRFYTLYEIGYFSSFAEKLKVPCVRLPKIH